MTYLIILLTVIGLGLLVWSEKNNRAELHSYIQIFAGLFWLTGAILGIVVFGLVKGLLFQLVVFLIGGAMMPLSGRK
jgi:hypothetical protein